MIVRVDYHQVTFGSFFIFQSPPVEYDYIAEADSKDANGDYSQLYDK